MRAVVLCVAALAIAAMAQTPVPTPTASLSWEDLFAPPYSTMPEISMGIGCVSANLCYLPGGSNGQGFGMYSFNGQANGNLNLMNEPNMTLMILTTAVGGNETNPVGAFAGVGMFTISRAIQYLSAGTTWLPSAIGAVFVFESQSMRSTHDGQHIIALGSGTSSSVMMYSSNAGVSFTSMPVTVPLVSANCTAPGYAAMVDAKTWYMTLGSYPSSNHHGSGSGSSSTSGSNSNSGFPPAAEFSEVIKREGLTSSIVRNEDGTVSRRFNTIAEGISKLHEDQCHNYSGQIAKTTDGGKTWTNLISENKYTFAQIDCTSATHCISVGYGVNAAGNQVSRIVLTTDGKTFTTVYETTATAAGGYSFQTVRFLNDKEAWVGGAYQTQSTSSGAFWSSLDGGKTWTLYPSLQPNIVMIMDMAFVDGTGFAVGMTTLKTATILRYKKQHNDGFFVQTQCPVAGCKFLCQNMSFPQGFCMPVEGGSAMAFCEGNQLIQQSYETTSCVGSFNVSTMPVNVCLNSTQGNYFENFCPTSTEPRPQQFAPVKRFRHI